MSVYNRYLFAKEIYPNYIVFIDKKGKINTYDNDLLILNYIKENNYINNFSNYDYLDYYHINYIIIENIYFYYFKIVLLYKVLSFIYKK